MLIAIDLIPGWQDRGSWGVLVSLLLTGTPEMFIFKALLTTSSLTNQGWHATHLTCVQQWNSDSNTHAGVHITHNFKTQHKLSLTLPSCSRFSPLTS